MTGQQLLLQTLEMLLDSIDNVAPGSEGWTPETGPEVEMKREADQRAERDAATELETEVGVEADTADEYAVCP